MRKYAKVSPRIWTGRLGKAIRGDRDTQLVALYLLSCPHANLIGLYHLPMSYIVGDTGLTIEGASKGLQRLAELGFAHYDDDLERVWVVEHFRHEVGESLTPTDKRAKAAATILQDHESSTLYEMFLDFYGDSVEGASKGHRRGIEKNSKPHRSQEQEQEHSQEQEQEHSPECAREEDDPTWPARQEAEFEQVWSNHPVKDARMDAQRAWTSTYKDRPPTPEIVAHQNAMKQTDRWREGFVPNLGRYIREQMWTTVPETLNKPKKPQPPPHDPIAATVKTAKLDPEEHRELMRRHLDNEMAAGAITQAEAERAMANLERSIGGSPS